MKDFVLTLLVTVLLPSAILTEPKNKEAKRLEASAKVLFKKSWIRRIVPFRNDLLGRCECISIISLMKKG